MPYGKNTTGNNSSGEAAGYQSDCLPCPMGYYCLNATIVPYACGKGKYSKSGQSVCPSCPAGRYCDQDATGFDDMESNKTCPAGRYCSGGLTDVGEATDCSKAHYCPQGMQMCSFNLKTLSKFKVIFLLNPVTMFGPIRTFVTRTL